VSAGSAAATLECIGFLSSGNEYRTL